MRCAFAAMLVACGAEPTPTPVRQAESSETATRETKPQTAAPVVAVVGPEPLVGGYTSLDELGQAIVAAIANDDEAAAWATVVDAGEFRTRLFPALINTPSAMKFGADMTWNMMASESRGDLRTVLRTYGGHPLAFVAIESSKTKDRGELLEHLEAELRVTTADGAELRLAILGPIVEHRATHTFKLLTFRER